MLPKDRNIVKIDYDIVKGLVLKWNFKGYLSTTFFRHVIILDVDRTFPFLDFVNTFYSKIKLGDFINLGFVNRHERKIIIGWKEKAPLTQLFHKKLKPTINSLQNLVDLITLVDQEMNDFEEPVIFSVLSQRSQKQLIEIEKYMGQFVEKRKKYSANIFCNAKTSINPSKGLNLLNLNDFQSSESWSFFKSYLSQIALLRVKITIECQNGSISSQKNSEWKSMDFNRIQRQLKMPTVNYLQDIVEFLNYDFRDDVNYLLNIKLEYEELNQNGYNAQKNISIKLQKKQLYKKTHTGYQSQMRYQLTPNMISLNNPYESKTLIWFSKNIQEN